MKGLQSLLSDHADWEIAVAVDVPGTQKRWPGMGLVISKDGVVDELRREFLPKRIGEFRISRSSGARSVRCPITAMLVVTVIAVAPPIHGMAREAAPHYGCDPATIAKAHIARHFPSFDGSGLRLLVSEQNDVWEITYDLPDGTLGGAPVVTIGKRTCAVVRARHTQ